MHDNSVMMFYCCPSIEAVKQLLAMAVQHVCPCQEVVESAWRQWVQLRFHQQQQHSNTANNVVPSSVSRPCSRHQQHGRHHSVESNEDGLTSRRSSHSSSSSGSCCSSITADTVVRIHPSWYVQHITSRRAYKNYS